MGNSTKVIPRLLSGFKDRLPQEAMTKLNLLSIVSKVFESFGFVPIETPHLEYADILSKQGGDDIQKELYKFIDNGGREVGLRFDQTVPLARFISLHRDKIDLPFKRYVIGNVFRGEKAQRGRYREFTQCDFDFIGSNAIGCDVEIIQVIYASMLALDIKDFTIWINNRKILSGICKHFNVKNEILVLRLIDKLDKIGVNAVKDELSKIMDVENAASLLEIVNTKQEVGDDDFMSSIAHLKEWNSELNKGIKELEELYGILSSLDIDKSSYRVNLSIARGLNYYTGVVYETILNNAKELGSVCSGGRYDDLAKSFLDDNISGVGASIGIDRLLSVIGDNPKGTTARVLVVPLDKGFLSYSYKIAEMLRSSGIPIEVYPDCIKLKKQLAYANNKKHEFVALIGENEANSNTVTLKNMTTGIQMNETSLLKSIELLRSQVEKLLLIEI